MFVNDSMSQHINIALRDNDQCLKHQAAIANNDIYSVHFRVHQENEVEIEKMMDKEQEDFSFTQNIFENRADD